MGKPTAKSITKPTAKPTSRQQAHWYATVYVRTTAILSSILNAWSAVHTCQGTGVQLVFAGTVGACIPALVYMLFQIAGHLFIAKKMYTSGLVASVALIALALSLSHLAHAFSVLLSSGELSSLALAICIDAGMCISEWACITAHKSTK